MSVPHPNPTYTSRAAFCGAVRPQLMCRRGEDIRARWHDTQFRGNELPCTRASRPKQQRP